MFYSLTLKYLLKLMHRSYLSIVWGMCFKTVDYASQLLFETQIIHLAIQSYPCSCQFNGNVSSKFIPASIQFVLLSHSHSKFYIHSLHIASMIHEITQILVLGTHI